MKYPKLLNLHKLIGAYCALFIIVLSLTGILIQHGDELQLEKRKLSWEWLHTWYGYRAPRWITSQVISQGRVTQIDQLLFLDEKEIGRLSGELIGALKFKDLLVVAAEKELAIFMDGEFVEKVESHHGLPVPLSKIAADQKSVILQNLENLNYRVDLEQMGVSRIKAPLSLTWSRPEEPPTALKNKLMKAYWGEGLSLQKIVLDLHSGQFFGRAGKYLIDAAACGLIFLAGSGLWMLLKSKA